MATPLQDAGSAGGRAKARRLLQQAGRAVRRPKRGLVTPERRHRGPIAPPLVARQCAVAPPEQGGATDIPSLWPADGWRY